MIAAVLLIIDFFILPWVMWEARPEGAVMWGRNPMTGITAATKAGLSGVWLIPLTAVAVLITTAVELKIKKSVILVTGAAISGLALVYFVGAVSTEESIEWFQFMPQRVTAGSVQPVDIHPILLHRRHVLRGITTAPVGLIGSRLIRTRLSFLSLPPGQQNGDLAEPEGQFFVPEPGQSIIRETKGAGNVL